jgi:hypothetical protein
VNDFRHDELWLRVAARVARALDGAPICQAELSAHRDDRRVWHATTAMGQVIVKASAHGFAAERAAWAASAWQVLSARGYPVPSMIWHGPLDDRWYLLIQTRLPGARPDSVTPQFLADLLALIELQAGVGQLTVGWDISWWVGAILFDGWEGWWEATEAAAPETARRLRAFLAPASGYRLPGGDVVHHDFSLGNVLTSSNTTTGVVDWDHAGSGSRAVDIACLLFDCQRFCLLRPEAVQGGCAEPLMTAIVALVGTAGLRCVLTYAAIDCIAEAARRGAFDEVRTWELVTGRLLEVALRQLKVDAPQ